MTRTVAKPTAASPAAGASAIAAEASIIRLQQGTKVFYTEDVETHALAGIDFEIRASDHVTVAGPSGCEKSTLLSILGLLDTPAQGRYWLNGAAVEGLSFKERARARNRSLGFIFQSFNLIGDLAVAETSSCRSPIGA